MNRKIISRELFNKVCPLGDYLDALGLGFYEQRGDLRRYMLVNRSTGTQYNFTVNTARNEWISRRDNKQGLAADLADYLQLEVADKEKLYDYTMFKLYLHYEDRGKLPAVYPFVDIHVGMKSFVSKGNVQSHAVHALLTTHGISLKTADDCGVKEMRLLLPYKRETEVRLAFPCDNGSCYVFDGKTYRPMEDKSITTVGRHMPFQNCNVFENFLDYLAFQERRHRTGQYLLANDYNVILNGKANVEQAMTFLKQNPDFLEVRVFMPKTKDGDYLTQRILEATKGTAIDCYKYYEATGSMAADILPPLPDWYLEEQTAQKRKEQTQLLQTNEHDRVAAIGKGKDMVQTEEPIKGKGREQEIILDNKKNKRKGFRR